MAGLMASTPFLKPTTILSFLVEDGAMRWMGLRVCPEEVRNASRDVQIFDRPTANRLVGPRSSGKRLPDR